MDFDDFCAFLGMLFGLAVLVLVVFGIYRFIAHENEFRKAPAFEQRAILLSENYKPSTLQTHVVPIFHNGKMSTAINTTGHSQKFTTIWDCGKYGKLISEQEEVFRFAQPESILYLKEVGNECRIWGIKY